MGYTPNNNPYIPGDPYSYDLKWIVNEIKTIKDPEKSAAEAKASAESAAVSEENAAQSALDAAAVVDNLNAFYNLIIMPEKYGAVGDGVTDDTTAFNDMFTAVRAMCNSNGTMFQMESGATILLTGKYLITSPVSIDGLHGVKIKGSTATSTEILSANNSIFTSTDDSYGLRDFSIENVGFIYTGVSNSDYLLSITRPRDVKIKDCIFRSNAAYDLPSAHGIGIILSTTVGIEISNTIFYELYYGVQFVANVSLGQMTTINLLNCWFALCNFGITAALSGTTAYLSNLNVMNSIFDGCTRGVNLVSNPAYPSKAIFKNCHFEQNSFASILASNSIIDFDETNFMYIGTGSVGIIAYLGTISNNLNGNAFGKIKLMTANAINDISGVAPNNANIVMDIECPEWSYDAIKRTVRINAKQAIRTNAYVSGSTTYKVTFTSGTNYWEGYGVLSGGTFTATRTAGTITMVSDNLSSMQATEVGNWLVEY